MDIVEDLLGIKPEQDTDSESDDQEEGTSKEQQPKEWISNFPEFLVDDKKRKLAVIDFGFSLQKSHLYDYVLYIFSNPSENNHFIHNNILKRSNLTGLFLSKRRGVKN